MKWERMLVTTFSSTSSLHLYSHDRPFLPKCLKMIITNIILSCVAFLSRIITFLLCLITTRSYSTVLYWKGMQPFILMLTLSLYDFFILVFCCFFFFNLKVINCLYWRKTRSHQSHYHYDRNLDMCTWLSRQRIICYTGPLTILQCRKPMWGKLLAEFITCMG